MSAATSLRALVERYLLERRRLGFYDRTSSYCLRSLARHVQAAGLRGPLTAEIMADWARRDSHGSGNPQTWARRLKRLRSFTRWLQQFEPRTEVPDNAIFGRLHERLAPHIYSEQEVVDLLASARRLGPAPGLRGVIYETLFGLIAATGLRIGEALSLRNMDVDLKVGMLSIYQTKFGKSRQVPMHPSTVDALRRYRRMRDLANAPAAEDAAFFVGTRGRRRGLPLSDRQVHRVFGELRGQLGWRNRGTHHAPRIHDLRHNSESRIIPSRASVVFCQHVVSLLDLRPKRRLISRHYSAVVSDRESPRIFKETDDDAHSPRCPNHTRWTVSHWAAGLPYRGLCSATFAQGVRADHGSFKVCRAGRSQPLARAAPAFSGSS